MRDSAALLDASEGPELGDPYWAPPPARLVPLVSLAGLDFATFFADDADGGSAGQEEL